MSLNDTQYIIQLRSIYTGDVIHLGSSFKSKDEAEEYAKIEICHRCNYYDIFTVPSDFVWVNKNKGFMPIEAYKQYLEDRKYSTQSRRNGFKE